MKLTVYFAILLICIVALAAAVGYSPTQAKWGEDGIASMKAVAAICLASALVSILPLAFVAPRYPDQIGPAALAATAIRLLLTMGLLVGFQVLHGVVSVLGAGVLSVATGN